MKTIMKAALTAGFAAIAACSSNTENNAEANMTDLNATTTDMNATTDRNAGGNLDMNANGNMDMNITNADNTAANNMANGY